MKKTALFVMLVCLLLAASALADGYALKEDAERSYDVSDGVRYRGFMLTSGVNGVTVPASALEIDPDKCRVLPYSGAAGGAADLSEQYKLAKDEGYDPIGIINGDFFSMDFDDSKDAKSNSRYGNYGFLNEYLITDGEIISAANDRPAVDFGGMTAIDEKGKITVLPESNLHFDLFFNGEKTKGVLRYINKTDGCRQKDNWSDDYYYFDRHSGDLMDEKSISKALTYKVCPGVEVKCRKAKGEKLKVGGEMKGEVLSVTKDAFGGDIGKDEFIIFVRSGSPYASEAAALRKGDTVSVKVTETVPEAEKAFGDKVSVLACIGELMRGDKDLTASDDFNKRAPHSNTYEASWAAFGVKADGTWVFFTCAGTDGDAGNTVTLKDVERAMADIGCIHAIRLDGGGSTAMYVCDTGNGKPGYMQESDRKVGDCLMAVRRQDIV